MCIMKNDALIFMIDHRSSLTKKCVYARLLSPEFLYRYSSLFHREQSIISRATEDTNSDLLFPSRTSIINKIKQASFIICNQNTEKKSLAPRNILDIYATV